MNLDLRKQCLGQLHPIPTPKAKVIITQILISKLFNTRHPKAHLPHKYSPGQFNCAVQGSRLEVSLWIDC